MYSKNAKSPQRQRKAKNVLEVKGGPGLKKHTAMHDTSLRLDQNFFKCYMKDILGTTGKI
jgi:hypothetical protein